jgi:hypothetical protein
MNPAVPFEFVIDLDCSDVGKAPCRIFLLHRSQLGTFENAVRQPKGDWPLTFLCLRHERLSVRLIASVAQDQSGSQIHRPSCGALNTNVGMTTAESEAPSMCRLNRTQAP